MIHLDGHALQEAFDKKIRIATDMAGVGVASAICSTRAGFNESRSVRIPDSWADVDAVDCPEAFIHVLYCRTISHMVEYFKFFGGKMTHFVID